MKANDSNTKTAFPDGTKVVFAKIVDDSYDPNRWWGLFDSEIFIRDADGTNVKQLTFSAN